MTSARKNNKIMSFFLLVVFIATSFFNVGLSSAYATTAAEGESESEVLKQIQILPANGDTLNCVKLDGRPQLCRFSYYQGSDAQGNEKNYPTYCVEPNLEGVNTLGEYAATLTETVKHPKVYGAVLNGYPYKTLGELGVNSNLEGYYATRNVVWSLVKGWNISQWTSDGSEAGNRVLAAMQQIYNASKDYAEIPIELMVKVTKGSEKATVDTKDSQYVSTTYTITANKELVENITVEIQPNSAAPSAKIVDRNNNPKTTFAVNDDFKVIVLKSEADAAKDLRLDIQVEVSAKDNAIFYAKSQNPKGQDYYAARDPIAVKDVATTFLYGAAEPDTPDNPGNPDNPPIPPTPNAKGTLTINKLDAADNRPLAGAQFNVIKNGTVLGVYATNSQGKIEIPINTDTRVGYFDEHDSQIHYRNTEKNKVFDSYTITELDPPFGYLLDPVNTQVASTLADGNGGVLDDALVVTFKNDKYGELLIQKTDADTNAPLKGATFRVTYLPGADDNYHYTSDVTTDGTGSAALSGLKPGSYSIQEITAPSGYILDGKLETITVTAGKTVTYSAVNHHKPGLEITKLDANHQTAIAGVTFNIKGIDNSYDQDFTTGADGKITLENLETGSYQVTEVSAPPEYKLDPANTRSIELAAGQSVQLVFYNEQIPHLEILKLDAEDGAPISGVTFNIRGIDSTYNQDFITDTDGKIVLDTLEEGSYQITETAAPPEYKIDPANTRSVELQAGKSIELIFYNKKLPYLEINKIDKVSKQPLANVTFTISEKGGTKIGDYTTDTQGKIRLEELPEGWYTLIEKAVPDGVILDNTPHDIYVEAGKSVSITLENSRKPKLIIDKQDSITHGPVANAKFQVWRAVNGSLTGELQSIGIFTTDTNGKINLGQVEVGWYRITEIEAPHGYDLVSPVTRDVFMQADQDQTITFENTPKSALVVQKVDADTGEALSGAHFSVRYLGGTSGTGGTVIGEYITGSSGTFTVTSLEAGTYVIEETQAPENYLLTADTSKTVYISGKTQDVVTVTFSNKRISGLVVRKLDSITKQPLANAEFKITDSDGAVVGNSNGIFVTDTEGYIHLPDINPGTYVVTEIKAPNGYLLDKTPQTIKLQSNETHLLTFYNEPESQLIIEKLNAADHQPLAGAIFEVTNSKGEVVGNENGRFITDATGVITITGLIPDTYVVTELSAPDGFVLDKTAQTIKVEKSGTFSVTFYNYPKGSLVIEKLDKTTKEPLADAVFKVTTAQGTIVGNEKGLYQTDANGLIVIPNLPPNVYVVTEVTAPSGYLIDTAEQSITVTPEKVHQLTFYNAPKSQLVIEKLNAVDHQPLAGAIFEVTNSKGEVVGNENGRFTTDATGVIKLTGLTPDSYVVTELSAPDGFILDKTAQTIKVEESGTFTATFYNYPKSSLIIEKLDKATKEPLADAVFKVTTAQGTVVGSDNGLYRTDGSGLILIPNLQPGAYVVSEVNAPDGYLLDNTEQHIKITTEKVHRLTFYNQAVGGLLIKKMDAETKEPLADVLFKVTTGDGTVVGTNENGEYRTDDNGFISIRGLKPDTYLIQEIQAKEGYLLDDTPKTVVVKDEKTYTIEFFNHHHGNLLILKKDTVTGQPLAGATFKITNAAGEFTAANNGHLSSNGIYTTDENGQILLSSLSPDTYIVTEITAPDGYIIDSTPQTVVVNTEDTQTLTFTNAPKGGLTIIKSDEETGKRIANVTFEVRKLNGEIIGTCKTDSNGLIQLPKIEKGWYSVTELKAADGYMIDKTEHKIEIKDGETATLEIANRQAAQILLHKIDSQTKDGIQGVTFLLSDSTNKPIGQYTTDQNGYIYIDEGLNDGKYFIREIEAADGYQLDNSVRTIYVRYGTTSEIIWENTGEKGQIQIIKKSADDNPINGIPANTLLPNAVFEIYNKAGDVVDTIKTDKNGRAMSKPLPLSRYTVREVQAPDYYGINQNVLDAEIEFAGQIVKFEVSDPSCYINVSVDKTGYTQVMPGQEIQWHFQNIGNNSTVALQSFYWRDTLPIDAVRLEKIVTGTWNKQLSYKVSYKTNLHDYRTLADHLSTSKNNVLEASQAALGLAGNEYVTEIMFSFGIVQPGFAQVEAPKIYGTVLNNLPHEYRFVNNTDVGGIYQDQWQMANDRWVTVIYNQAGTPTLPKTGY